MKTEIQIPSYLIDNSIFSYGDMQTKLAELFSEGINYASQYIDAINPCNNLAQIRLTFRQKFFDYINDPTIKQEKFESSSSSIQTYNQFYRTDHTVSEIIPALFSSATNCN